MLTKLTSLLLVSTALCVAAPFRFTSVNTTFQTPQTGTIFVATAGDLAATVDFSNNKLWNLTVDEGNTEKQLDVKAAAWDAKSRTIAVTFDPADLAGMTFAKLSWTATFNNQYQATKAAPNANSPPKGKDDADLYVFGSYLAGVGTKPLYSIDAKLNWVPEIREGYFFGIESAVLVNSGVSAPVNRTRVDPDSLSAGLSFQHRFDELVLDFNPVKGEFSRKFPASDVVSTAALKWARLPNLFKGGAFVFYPSAGYEVGSNLNKPALLFKEPVNLSGYNTIARGVLGAHAALLFLKKSESTDAPYRLSIQADYTGRVLFEPEPFVTSGYLNGVLANLTSVRSNTRHYLEAGVLYNINDLLAVEIKYRYGSLPPLFEFVDHQVTIGITLKSNLPHTMRSGF